MGMRRHMLIFLFVSMQMGRDRSEAIKLGRGMPQWHLPLYSFVFAPKLKEDTFKLGRPICNLTTIKYYCFHKIHIIGSN
jgi:hypothetical protein